MYSVTTQRTLFLQPHKPIQPQTIALRKILQLWMMLLRRQVLPRQILMSNQVELAKQQPQQQLPGPIPIKIIRGALA